MDNLSTLAMTTYPFDHTLKQLQEFIEGKRDVMTCDIHEHDYVCEKLREAGVEWDDWLDTPEDVVIERV
jgi:predicted RNase H-like nuclease